MNHRTRVVTLALIAVLCGAGTIASANEPVTPLTQTTPAYNEQREAALKKVQEKRAEMMQQRVDQKAKLNTKQGWNTMFVARLRFVEQGFVNIITRLESRIEKMKAAGIDTAPAQDSLDEARASVAAIQTRTAELIQKLEQGTMTDAEKTAARIEIQNELQSAKALLRATVQALIIANQ